MQIFALYSVGEPLSPLGPALPPAWRKSCSDLLTECQEGGQLPGPSLGQSRKRPMFSIQGLLSADPPPDCDHTTNKWKSNSHFKGRTKELI